MIHAIAPGKINWTLEVLGRRRDDYHEVRSIMQTIELHDELTFEPADSLSLEVSGPHKPTDDDDDDDLVLQAARLRRERDRDSSGVQIRLDKRLPVAAGLGGGSSDAAATLRVLNEMWQARLGQHGLTRLAGGLGSDVAFFLQGGTALAGGRGEVIRALPDAPPAWLVLLVPGLSVTEKTRRLYEALTPADFTDGSRTKALADHISVGGCVEDAHLYNAFDRVAYEVFEGLTVFRDWLLEAGAPSVHVCGAGPSLFALASGEPESLAIRARLNRARRGERVHVVRTVTAAEATLAWSDP
ncbi:MAG TPA: 4-(cytidine 5'-diphospho)-2-C-methyl-D-erythritol kinase [Dehalococcoidia bacterium]